jgi:hypothetical protein
MIGPAQSTTATAAHPRVLLVEDEEALRRVSARILTLDMTLVRDIEKVHTKARLIHSLCTACRDLNVAVVAEGIETVRERDRVPVREPNDRRGRRLIRGRA